MPDQSSRRDSDQLTIVDGLLEYAKELPVERKADVLLQICRYLSALLKSMRYDIDGLDSKLVLIGSCWFDDEADDKELSLDENALSVDDIKRLQRL